MGKKDVKIGVALSGGGIRATIFLNGWQKMNFLLIQYG